MPRAGGQYVYLRESLGPIWGFLYGSKMLLVIKTATNTPPQAGGTIWGFLYGWTVLLVIQTATIAAVAIAFSKFTAVMVPWFSPSDWILKLGTFGPWHLWFGDLGPYNVGLNRQNLLAILSIIVVTWINTRGLRVGSIVQNIFTVLKIGSLAALALLRIP